MTKNALIGSAALLFVFQLLLAVAFADEQRDVRDYSKMTPSGTVEFDATSVKFLVGSSWGQGVLHYQGQSYPFKTKSLTAGGIGYREMKGSGNVYELDNLEDFPGIYAGGGAGVTIDKKTMSATETVLENGKGVVLRLTITDSEGLQLSASAGGIEIEFLQ